MTATARVAGHDFEFTPTQVERRMRKIEPEPIRDHFVVIGGRRYPPKQVLAEITGLDRADFTTHQARAVLKRLGFGAYRRSSTRVTVADPTRGPHGGAESQMLDAYAGRWIAQDGLEVLFDADSPEAVARWLRRHDRRARVWRVPTTPAEAGSMLTSS